MGSGRAASSRRGIRFNSPMQLAHQVAHNRMTAGPENAGGRPSSREGKDGAETTSDCAGNGAIAPPAITAKQNVGIGPIRIL